MNVPIGEWKPFVAPFPPEGAQVILAKGYGNGPVSSYEFTAYFRPDWCVPGRSLTGWEYYFVVPPAPKERRRLHVHSRGCYDDAGPGAGSVSLICGKVAGEPE